MGENKKKISLCLGGGGARGFIHVGVLRYLEEEGYEIQEVSGTSMGAVIGAALALGMNSQEIYDFIKEEFSYWKLLDFSFTKGLVAGGKIFSKLQEVYGKTKISHTKIPLKIIATCLDTSEKTVFADIAIVDAVRASLSVPALFEPHIIDGKHYIDGMLYENLPISVLQGENILAVSTLMSLDFPYTTTKQLLTKVFNISLLGNETLSLAIPNKDITLIRPVFDQVDFLDFHKYEELVEIGYQAAKKQLSHS